MKSPELPGTPDIRSARREYGRAVLDEADAPSDPLVLFAAWLSEAVAAGIAEPTAMVLSTAASDGGVSARVVLLKGVERNGFAFFTHYGSRKGRQLLANSNAALTFPWIAMERQVRVEGKAVRLPRRESVAYFNDRPLESRISACISPQSSIIPDRAFLDSIRQGFILDLGDRAPLCPPDWGGYVVRPVRIEFWQGREHRLHDRLLYRKTGRRWILERLAP